MTIAVTDNMGSERKLQLYIDWLRRSDVSVDAVTLSYISDNLSQLDNCNGLLLTGGGDVDPELYGQEVNDTSIKGVDRKRDDFERKIIDQALKLELPILGICRGLQIVNVHLGGTLIPDVENAGYSRHQSIDKEDIWHEVEIVKDSFLHGVAKCSRGKVNSSHHQAAKLPGKGLKIVAKSPDGVIEALEWEDGLDKPFFMLVQWHPERMDDRNNPFSQNILNKFLSSIQ
jgi:putative glutamine amidotransferase